VLLATASPDNVKVGPTAKVNILVYVLKIRAVIARENY